MNVMDAMAFLEPARVEFGAKAILMVTFVLLSALITFSILIISIIHFFRRKGKNDNYRICCLMLLLLAVFFLRYSVGLYRNATREETDPNAASESGGTLTAFEELFNSVVHTFQSFSMDETYTEYLSDGKEMAGVLFPEYAETAMTAVSHYTSVLNVAAALSGGAILLSILQDFFPKIRYLFVRIMFWRKKYYFSELNERSLASAKSIAEHRRWFPLFGPVLIFTDVYTDRDDEKSSELLIRAKSLGAVCLIDDIAHIRVTFPRQNEYWLMDDEEINNVKTLSEMADLSHYRMTSHAVIRVFYHENAYVLTELEIRKQLRDRFRGSEKGKKRSKRRIGRIPKNAAETAMLFLTEGLPPDGKEPSKWTPDERLCSELNDAWGKTRQLRQQAEKIRSDIIKKKDPLAVAKECLKRARRGDLSGESRKVWEKVRLLFRQAKTIRSELKKEDEIAVAKEYLERARRGVLTEAEKPDDSFASVSELAEQIRAAREAFAEYNKAAKKCFAECRRAKRYLSSPVTADEPTSRKDISRFCAIGSWLAILPDGEKITADATELSILGQHFLSRCWNRLWDEWTDKRAPVVLRTRCYQNLLYNLVREVPLYEPLVGCQAPFDLNVAIIGNGDIGMEMLTTVYWCGQMWHVPLAINLVSLDRVKDACAKIDHINPDILESTVSDSPILSVYPKEVREEYSDPYFTFRYCQADVNRVGMESIVCRTPTYSEMCLPPPEKNAKVREVILPDPTSKDRPEDVADITADDDTMLRNDIKSETEIVRNISALEKGKRDKATDAENSIATGETRADERRLLDSDYYLVALGSDDSNIRFAETLGRMIAFRQRETETSRDRNIIVVYVVYDAHLCRTLNRNEYRIPYVRLHAIGGLDGPYSMENINMADILSETESTNNSYRSVKRSEWEKKSNIFAKRPYEFWSSAAQKIHDSYKLFSAYVMAKEKDSSVTWEDFRGKDVQTLCETVREETAQRLAWIEHRRWNAYMRSFGFRRGRKKDVTQLLTHDCIAECKKDATDMSDKDHIDLIMEKRDRNLKKYDYLRFVKKFI